VSRTPLWVWDTRTPLGLATGALREEGCRSVGEGVADALACGRYRPTVPAPADGSTAGRMPVWTNSDSETTGSGQNPGGGREVIGATVSPR
jgi:hypothetical protein